jgi:hypothetical protein
MLSKYTFLAPNLIRVSGEGADYAYLICNLLILKRMLSKYTFLAPNLIRVSGEGADYAYLIASASPPRILRPLCPPTHHW